MGRSVFDVVHATEMRPKVVVCVLTMRRVDHLRETLLSLAEQDFEGEVACIVADNDPVGRQGAEAAAAMFRDEVLQGAAVVVTKPGHCSACNGAFAAARKIYPEAALIAMIDDDELAEPDWLRRLVDAQTRSGADLVGGPVLPRFEASDADRFTGHPVFTPYYTDSGPVAFLYGSGNFLMRSEVLDRIGQPYFDEQFDFVGGGDFDFFKRCQELGFTAYFEADARATETVPPSRTTVKWVMARSLRYGAINYMLERKAARSGLAKLRITLKSTALLGIGTLRGLRKLVATGNLLAASHPMMESIGRVAAQFGRRPEQYRVQPPKPDAAIASPSANLAR